MQIRTVEMDAGMVAGLRHARDEYADKRAFGHALLVVGSKGMMGAAVLAAGGALRSGCGLVTVHVPEGERTIMHVSHPSAIVDCDPGDVFTGFTGDLSRYTAVGIGCGLGRKEQTAGGVSELFRNLGRITDGAMGQDSTMLRPDGSISGRQENAGYMTDAGSGRQGNAGRIADMALRQSAPGLVIDADALNIIASHPEMFDIVPPGSILTPHTRELDRLMHGLCAGKSFLSVERHPFPYVPECPGATSFGRTGRGTADGGTEAVSAGGTGAVSAGDGSDCGFPEFTGWKYPWEGPQMEYVAVLADRLESVIIVKGHRTLVCPPAGMAVGLPVAGAEVEVSPGMMRRSSHVGNPQVRQECVSGRGRDTGMPGPRTVYVNTTGNAGMAKGGSGDVLTGLITGLRAVGYSPVEAAILGVWYHGQAGDRAAERYGQESMNASDIADSIRL